jgi:hypothetical protein
MIRCHKEATERMSEKKLVESRERPFVAFRRLSFEALLSRDVSAWRVIETADELARVASQVRKELLHSDFDRFTQWVCAVHGTGLARAAGLQIAPLRIELAS